MMLPLDDILIKYGIAPNGVLHCGANEGQEADTYNNWRVKRVYWVEANPETYRELKSNLKYYHNQYPLLACLSNEDGKLVKFNISNNQSQSSSILELSHHKIIHPEVHYINEIELETVTIDTLFRRMELDYGMIDFMNLDLQGAELMALEGGTEFLKQIKCINTEVNKQETYSGCALIDELDLFLLQYGFERVETGEWVADTWTDAFYLRK